MSMFTGEHIVMLFGALQVSILAKGAGPANCWSCLKDLAHMFGRHDELAAAQYCTYHASSVFFLDFANDDAFKVRGEILEGRLWPTSMFGTKKIKKLH